MTNSGKHIIIAGIFGFLGAAVPALAQQVATKGPVTFLTLPNGARQLGGQGIDFAHAIAMPMPVASGASVPPAKNAPAVKPLGPAGFSPGGTGNGEQDPVQLVPPQQLPQNTPAPQGVTPQGVTPFEFGTFGVPYTTSEVNASFDLTVAHYPFSAAGKLFFNIGSTTSSCSARLIKLGMADKTRW